MAALELAQQQRDEASAWAGRCADRQRAVQLARLLLRKLLLQLLFDLQHPLRALVQDETRFGRLDAPAGAVEQAPSEALLERADLQADRRLGHAETLGRL